MDDDGDDDDDDGDALTHLPPSRFQWACLLKKGHFCHFTDWCTQPRLASWWCRRQPLNGRVCLFVHPDINILSEKTRTPLMIRSPTSVGISRLHPFSALQCAFKACSTVRKFLTGKRRITCLELTSHTYFMQDFFHRCCAAHESHNFLV